MQTRKANGRVPSSTPCIEMLEMRQMLSHGNVLTIAGTSGSDFITATFRRDGIKYAVNGRSRFALYERGDEPLRLVVIDGKAGNDVIKVLATGFDSGEEVSVRGGAGNDRIYVSTATVNVTADGGAGNDNMTAGNNRFFIRERDQSGVIFNGSFGNDVISGSAGDDELLGGPGNDTLTASTGEDTVQGGSGNDVIVSRLSQDDGAILDGGWGYNRLISPDGEVPIGADVRRIQDVFSG